MHRALHCKQPVIFHSAKSQSAALLKSNALCSNILILQSVHSVVWTLCTVETSVQ